MKTLFYGIILAAVLTMAWTSTSPLTTPEPGIQKDEVAARYHHRGRTYRFFKRGTA